MANNGNENEALTWRQRRAIASLLTEKDIKAAARAAQVGHRTLCRWLTESTFRQALSTAEGDAIDGATRRLVGLADSAVDTLGDLLDSKDASETVRLRAAQSIIDNLLKLRELRNLEQRIAALEERIK